MLNRVYSYIFLLGLLILAGCRTPTPDIELPTRVPISNPPTYLDDTLIPDTAIPNQIIVTFDIDTTPEERLAYIESIGGTIVQSIAELNTIVINVPANSPLPESPAITTTEPDYYVVALQDDPLYAQQWALPVINAPDIWTQLPENAPSVTVAVIDSGVCLDHPDLIGHVINGYDFVENDNIAQDDFGHGCAVAGVIAANHNTIGIAGVAPNAAILPLRVLDANGFGAYSDVAAAIVYATDNGAQVINLSLGGTNASTTLQNAIDYAIAHNVMVIAAAGNTGGPMLYPAAYDPVIAVGSIDQDLRVSDFSALGDIYAPGSGIMSLKTDGTYGLVSGTSFAAPHVSSMAALSIAQGTELTVNGQIVGSNSEIRNEPDIVNTDNNMPTDLNNPTHYIVFQHNTNGVITPLFHQYVAMPETLQSLSTEQLAVQTAQSSRNAYQATVMLVDDNNTVVYQNVVKIPRWMRGEFHDEDGSGAIDSNFIELEESSFVVRVPVIPNTSLLLQTSLAASTTLFDPFEIGDDPNLPLAGLSFNMPQSTTGQGSGDPANRLDVLIIGEGYTAAEFDKFQTDAANAETNFASISPYSDYANFINFTTLFVASNQSGADHPPYNSSCTSTFSCCADGAASSDPKAGTYVDTAFDGSYCWSVNVHRLLSVNGSKIYTVAKNVPDWDEILVIVNDDVYGGAGGWIGVFSTHSLAIQVAQHEFGHSFIDLADEYESAYPGYPACSDTNPNIADCEDNVTNQTTRALIKWLRWIDESTPVITPETSPYTSSLIDGLYEGARYLSSEMYRPTYRSIMRSLGQPFNNPSAESFALKLYNGWGGMPVNGIDNIEPGTESHIPNSIIETQPPDNVTLSVDLLAPIGYPLDIKWYVNNQLVATDTSETTASYTFVPTSSGTHTIRLDVTDVSGFVHPSLQSTLTTSRTWYVDVKSVDLSIAKSSDAQVVAGSDLSYTLTVNNNGPHAATNVVITDTLTVDLTLISTSPNVCTANGQVVTCNLGTLANQGQTTVTLNTLVDADTSGGITNTAVVTSDGIDTDTENNTDSVITSVIPVIEILISEQEFQQELNQHLSGDIVFVVVDLLPDKMKFTIQLSNGTVGDVVVSATQRNGFIVLTIDSVSKNGAFQAAVNKGLLPMLESSLDALFTDKFGADHDVDYLRITDSQMIGLFVVD